MSGDYHATWFESGIGAVLSTLLRVPRERPSLPAREGERVVVTHPARGFLQYSLLGLWIVVIAIFFGLVIISGLIAIDEPELAIVVFLLGAGLLTLFSLFMYLMTYVVYCNTWYVVSNRAVRIRTGVITILEATITFENVQNVSVSQGPLQRMYGIADVQIDTAGGGIAAGNQPGQNTLQNLHKGVIRGVSNAEELRNLIVGRMKTSRSSGLGDELLRVRPQSSGMGPQHIAALREVRDALKALAR